MHKSYSNQNQIFLSTRKQRHLVYDNFIVMQLSPDSLIIRVLKRQAVLQ